MKTLYSIIAVIVVSLLWGCHHHEHSTASFAPHRLTVGAGFTNPIGYNLEDSTLSWQIPLLHDGIKQSAYRIQVARDYEFNNLVADTQKVMSSQSNRVPNPDKSIKTGEHLYWRVKVWDETGKESAWSRTAFFEAGLMTNSCWKGKWIFSPTEPTGLYNFKKEIDDPLGRGWEYSTFRPTPKKGIPPTYLRKTFTSDKAIKEARLYVASRGIFRISINGRKVGKDFWGTGWTNYDTRIQANTYCVNGYINSAKNVITAVVADGWYTGRIKYRKNSDKIYRKPELLVQLVIEYKDGTTKTIVSDETWKTSHGRVKYADIYDGQANDLNLEPVGWREVNFDDSSWKNVLTKNVEAKPLIEPRRNQPVRVNNVLDAISVKKIAKGTFIFDFGQNLTGIPNIKMRGKKGQTIKIRFAEMLQKDGTLYDGNYRSALSTDYFTFADDKPVYFSPEFTFHGYRYVELSGFDDSITEADLKVQSLALYNDMPATGKFSCNVPYLNQLQNNILWGQRSNYLSVPTDCPQRDERMGWSGDAQVFIPTATFNMNVNAFFNKWMFEMLDEQTPEGSYPHVAPHSWGNGSPAWSDAGVICPYVVYLAYGDKEILRRNYNGMKKWIEFQKNTSKNLIRPELGFGDWLQPSSTKGNDSALWVGTTPRRLIGTAYFYRTTKMMQRIANVLGKTDDEKYFADLAKKIYAAFNKEFVRADGTVATNSQTGYLLALGFDLIPENLTEKAVEKLVKKIESDNWTLDTGFVGTPLIAPVLSRLGRHDVAERIVLNEEYPSWIYSIKQGATTMWERWNGFSHEKGFGNPTMNSFNHYAYGAVGEWLYRYVGGIWYDEENVGYKNIIFEPKPTKRINSAKAEYETPYGLAKSEWSVKNGKMKWNLVIPANATGTIKLPTKDLASATINGKPAKSLVVKNVSSGVYKIEISNPTSK